MAVGSRFFTEARKSSRRKLDRFGSLRKTEGGNALHGEVGVNVNRAINIGDLQKMAKRRLPRVVYDFIEGGVEDELGIARNEASFDRERLVPRYLVDVSKRDQSCDLFDRKYASPFGVSATGLAALFRPGAGLLLAEAAAAAKIPFMMSGLSTASIEAAAKVAPSHSWYQLYVARDREITLDLIRRVREAGFGTLVLTVDVPVSSKRERNLRNGFALPPKLTTASMLDALRHPGWVAGYLRHGMPRFENWVPYARANSTTTQINAFAAKQAPASSVTWKDLEEFRQRWRGIWWSKVSCIATTRFARPKSASMASSCRITAGGSLIRRRRRWRFCRASATRLATRLR
jgi:(S)-mandelate dehydrogenase